MSGDTDEEYQKIAEPYLDDIGFAFFAANFHYSMSDYEKLTPRQKVFIYKAYENKMITETTNLYNAMFTAFYNANRPKRKKALKLFTKRNQKADKDLAKENLSIVMEVERTEGKFWVDLIYKENGLRKEVNNG